MITLEVQSYSVCASHTLLNPTGRLTAFYCCFEDISWFRKDSSNPLQQKIFSELQNKKRSSTPGSFIYINLI